MEDFIRSHVSGKKGKALLKGILVPFPPSGTWGKFVKQSVRSAIDFALISVAVRCTPAEGKDPNGAVIRIFIGAMAPEPFSLTETTRELARGGDILRREDLIEKALKEANAKMALVRETAVTVRTKQQSLQVLRRVLEGLSALLPR